MNTYERKQADRKARLEASAANAEAQSTAVYSRAREMAQVIPFGQPILVGHHSEKRDRGFRNRIHNTFGKSFALQEKAEYLAQKAASVGTGGISSDDPDATSKLRTELATLETTQERMKAANKAIRANAKKEPAEQVAALVAIGFKEQQAANLLEKDFAGRVGFPGYALTNNNANIRRIKARIVELEKLAERVDVEEDGEGYTYREDTEENRVMFVFDGKPAAAIRSVLKAHAFKWSPSRGAWVRQLNNAGIRAGAEVKKTLNSFTKIGD